MNAMTEFIARIQTANRIVIPPESRREEDVAPGDWVRVIIKKIPVNEED